MCREVGQKAQLTKSLSNKTQSIDLQKAFLIHFAALQKRQLQSVTLLTVIWFSSLLL